VGCSSHRHPRWPVCQDPTPYDIFNLARGAPYSKAGFYELVKIYHPDRSHHMAHHSMSHTTKLERYHLVVAANEILRDPVKRRAYDLHGAGWGRRPDAQSLYRNADRPWRQEPGNAANNATWEDWQRWYEERDGKRQEPVFMSNAGFAAIILLFVLVGGWGQATRAGRHSVNIVESRDRRHEGISRDMRQRQSEFAGLTREGRVESFLRLREGWGYSSAATRHDSSHK